MKWTDRFWAKVSKASVCWIWTGALDKDGYGVFRTPLKSSDRAHRVAFILAGGKIPHGMMVLHHCDNPSCVNPAHLYAGTHADNTKDAVDRKRMAAGERNGTRRHPEKLARGSRQGLSKLTESQVQDIRKLRKQGATLKQLAAMANVSIATIGYVCNGSTWKHVGEVSNG